jgi:gamma-tubulin complex component 5
LDLTLQFSVCLSAFAGETSLDISRHSLVLMRHGHRRLGRSRRARKPDFIGFAEALPPSEEDSESESDDVVGEPSAIAQSGVTVSLAEDGFFPRLERISLELDALMRFVRRGVDSLAAGAGDASATFGILAFYLEDWDM